MLLVQLIIDQQGTTSTNATTLSADDRLTSHESRSAAGSHDQTVEQPPSDSEKQEDVPTSNDGNTDS